MASRARAVRQTLLLTLAIGLAIVAVRPGASPPDRGLDEEVASLGERSGVVAVVAATAAGVRAVFPDRSIAAEPHNIKSASKSLLSLLVGIAVDRGQLEDLEVPVARLLPEAAGQLPASHRRSLRVRHLLTMTAGLESTSGSHYGAWVATENWVAAALGRPPVGEPGDDFIYSTGSSHVLAAALERAVGGDLVAWSERVLFAPLGVDSVRWARDPLGRPFGGNNLTMSPLDLTTVGRMVAADGRWDDEVVVPRSWLERSARESAAGWPDRYGAYGLGWWLPADGGLLAVGYGGQFLLVDRERDALCVVVSSAGGKGAAWDRTTLAAMARVVDALGDHGG